MKLQVLDEAIAVFLAPEGKDAVVVLSRKFHEVEHVHRDGGGELVVIRPAGQLADVQARPVKKHPLAGVSHVLHLDFDVDQGARGGAGKDIQAAGLVRQVLGVELPIQELQGGDLFSRGAIQHGVAEGHEDVAVLRGSEDPLEGIVVHPVDDTAHGEHSLLLARPRGDLSWWYFTANEGAVG